MTTNIYLVEDHPVMQQMLCAYLNRLAEVTVCGVASSAQEALAALPAAHAALALSMFPCLIGVALNWLPSCIDNSLPCVVSCCPVIRR
jgi:DNA-binding NarL/FixJ family response regulator